MTVGQWRCTKGALIGLMFFLSACGGPDLVATSDDSVDYKSARSLPPLKKVSNAKTVNNVAIDQAQSPDVNDNPVTIPASDTAVADNINASVVYPQPQIARLQLDGSFDQAWRYLTKQLLASDVTLHSRNKAAGLFSIGCNGISELARTETVKKGGWSFFNRSPSQSEYCSLQILNEKDTLFAIVLNQFNNEIAGADAVAFFNRLTN